MASRFELVIPTIGQFYVRTRTLSDIPEKYFSTMRITADGKDYDQVNIDRVHPCAEGRYMVSFTLGEEAELGYYILYTSVDQAMFTIYQITQNKSHFIGVLPSIRVSSGLLFLSFDWKYLPSSDRYFDFIDFSVQGDGGLDAEFYRRVTVGSYPIWYTQPPKNPLSFSKRTVLVSKHQLPLFPATRIVSSVDNELHHGCSVTRLTIEIPTRIWDCEVVYSKSPLPGRLTFCVVPDWNMVEGTDYCSNGIHTYTIERNTCVPQVVQNSPVKYDQLVNFSSDLETLVRQLNILVSMVTNK